MAAPHAAPSGSNMKVLRPAVFLRPGHLVQKNRPVGGATPPRAGVNGNGVTAPNAAIGRKKTLDEMMVADLNCIDTVDTNSPRRTMPVPPRESIQLGVNSSSSSSSNVQPAMLGKALPRLSGQAQRLLDQLIAGQNNGGGGGGENLSVVETKLRQQTVELRQAKMQLAERDAEVAQLKSEAAEREGRLRSTRVELMEAKASSQERELKLREVFAQLAEAGVERARLREELVQTKMELADTQKDLEELADEILTMKDLVLNQSELEELAAAENAAMVESKERVSDGMQRFEAFSAASSTAAAAGGEMAAAAAHGTWEVLQSLAAFSRQVLDDAKQDEAAFTGAGILNGLSSFGMKNNNNSNNSNADKDGSGKRDGEQNLN